jgi:cob(I)alamin adenosyltransferase
MEVNQPPKRYIQIFTGNGKGKTAAAIGLALRAAGAGLKTLIIMFMKEYPYSEIKALQRYSDFITVERYGNDNFVIKKQEPSEEDKQVAREALNKVRKAMTDKKYDMIILDEICAAVYFHLLKAEDIIPVLENKPDGVELILTGRYCPDSWIEKADLVTEMKEIKHYYQKGVISRKGFDS